MNEMKKKCWSCGKFSAYYTRGFCCLMKEDNGFCREYNKVVKKLTLAISGTASERLRNDV